MDATIPLLFAVAMAVDGRSGLLVGRLYDAYGPRVLVAVPVAAAIAAIAFTSNVTLLWLGVAIGASSTASWTPPSRPS